MHEGQQHKYPRHGHLDVQKKNKWTRIQKPFRFEPQKCWYKNNKIQPYSMSFDEE